MFNPIRGWAVGVVRNPVFTVYGAALRFERGHVVAPGTALGTCPRSGPVRDHAGPRDEANRSESGMILLGVFV